jgi:hypothetical protein
MKRLFSLLCFMLLSSQAFGAEAWFEGAHGARIHYRYRPGQSPAVVVVHGRSIASEGFSAWERGLLPGRALLILDRRGYEPSGGAAQDLSLNAADLAKAVALARDSSGGKVGIIAFSLGARFLPALNADAVAWLALVNPASPSMLKRLDPAKATWAWTLKNNETLSRFWLPAARRAWVASAARDISEDLIERLGSHPAAKGIRLAFERRLSSEDFQELLVRETIFALFEEAALRRDPGVPVLLVSSVDDEVVPPASYDDLEAVLREQGGSVVRLPLPGGHLIPLLEAEKVLRAVAQLDRTTDSRSSR